MNLDKQNRRSIMILISFTVLLYLGVSNIGMLPKYLTSFLKFLTPITISLVVALIMNAIMGKIEERIFGKPWKKYNNFRVKAARPISILITLVLALGTIMGVMFIVIPELISTISNLANQIPQFFMNIEKLVNDWSRQAPEIENFMTKYNLDLANIGQRVFSWVQTFGTTLLNNTVNFSVNVISAIFNFVLGFILAIYILAQKEKLGRQMRSLLYSTIKESRADRIIEVSRLSLSTFTSFMTGQMLECVILGVLFFIAMNIFGFPYALLISVLIMVTAMVPMIGSFIAAIVGFLLILTTDPIQAIWFVVLFLIIQQIEGNLIYPRVVGKSVGLSPIWILVSITVGGSLAGVMGMLLSIPVVSVAYTLMSDFISRRLDQKRIPYFKTNGV